jgi:antitoxin (DNA-binding transcriptional repressor) of toxin-antitoxin stability system
MTRVSIKELSDHTSEIARRVREDHETIELTFRGEVFARIEPVRSKHIDPEEFERIWAERDRLAAEIGKHWPQGATAAQAIAEDRR